MFHVITKLFKHSVVYGFGIILSKLVSFVMLPVYTRFLTPEDYGVLEILVLTVDIAGTVIGAGVTYAVFRYYDQYQNEDDKREVISTALVSTITIFALFFLLLYLFSDMITLRILGQIKYSLHLKLALVNLFLTVGYEIPMAFVQVKKESFRYVTISTIRLIIQLSLNIYFVAILRFGVIGVLYSTLISSAIFSLYLTIITFRETRLKVSARKLFDLYRYGAPLLFSDISAFVLTFSDRFFLNHYNSLADVGVYALGYKFGMLLAVILIAPFNQIWSVQMFEIAKKDDSGKLFAKIFLYLMVIAVLIGLVIALVSKDIIRIMANPEFWDAYKVVPIVVLAYVVYSFYIQAVVGVLVSKRTEFVAMISLIAACSNVAFNFWLIPTYGGFGAAWATVFAFTVRFGGIYLLSAKFLALPYNWLKALQMLAGGCICYGLGIIFSSENILLSLCIHILLVMLFCVGVYVSNIFDASEKRYLIECIRNPIKTLNTLRLAREP